MKEAILILALAAVVVGLSAYAAWSARRRALRVAELERPHDWRETWCCPECMAAHDQTEPCGDCPARRMTRF